MTVLERPASEEAVTQRIHEATVRLSKEFSGRFSQQDVERVADEWLAQHKEAPVVEFLPLLLERFTRERLLTLQAQAAR
jgi:hypothetical protein